MKHRRKGRIAAWLLTAALLINGTVPGTPFVSRALAAENTVTITPAQSADADPSRTGTGQMTISLKIKGAIQPSVTLEGWTKGDTPKTPVVTGNTGNGTVTITYQVNKSGAYTSDVPTTAGTHSVKVTIAESEDYLGGEATADFVIAPADTTSQMEITLDIHKHSFTYAADGARITATCGETGGTCDLTGRAVSFTLTAPAKTKDIDSNSAEATLSSTELAAFNQATGLNVSAQDIKYVGRGNTAYAESTTAPTVAGTYTAKVTVGTGENTATATVDYTIASSTTTSSMTITLVIKNTPSVTAPEAKTLTYDGTTQELVTSGSTNDGTIKYAIGDDDTTAPAEDAFTATVPTRKNAGTYYVWYLVKGNDGYKDVAPACVPVTIAKANATVTAPTANTLTYNGQDQALVSGGTTQDGTLQYAIGTSATTAPTTGFGTAIPSGKTAGTYYVWYKVVGDSNHNDLVATTPVTAEIGKAAITITADDKSTQYGADIAELTYVVSGAYVTGDDLGVTVSTTATNASPVNTYPISISWNNNANYTATMTNGTYTITKADLTVSASGYSGTYDEQAHGISVDVGNSGATVYYGTAELTEQNYSNAGSTTNPTYTDAGTYTVYYYVTATNYDPQPVKGSQTVTIAKANVEVTMPSAATLTYDGSDRALVSGGSVTGRSFAYALGENGTTAPTDDHAWNAGVPTGKNAGTYYVWYKGVGDGNHNDSTPACITVTIGKKAATISANAASKTYGDADPTLTATVAGTVGNDTLNYTLGRTAGENVDNYAITVTVEATANPNYDITVNGNTFTINKKALTITADSATKVYDTTALTKNSYTNTDLATGDSIESVTIIGSQTTAASSTNVPSGAVIKKGETDVTANYEITYENGTLTVTKATTNIVTVDITGWTYGSAANAPTSNANFGADTVVYTYSDKADGTYTATVPTHAGMYYVKATVAGTDNYAEGSAVKGFTIAKKAATITADAKSKTYGDADPALTYMATGLVGNDALTGTLARTEGETVGTYAITQGTVDSNDYDITYVGANLTVNTRAVVVSNILAKDKKHDGNTEATLDYSYVNFENIVAADAGKLTVSAVGTFDDAQIGNDKNVTITGLTLGGEVAANYVLAAQGQQTNATADISDMAATDSADGRFRTEVKDFEGFKAQVTGLDLELAKSLCTPAELAAYEAGGKLELELEVGLAGAAMTGDVVELVTNAVKNQKQAKLDGALYLDITLYKVVNGVRTKVTNLSGKSINIKLSVPGDMENRIWENRRTFYAVRVHSGVATVLSETTSMEIPFSTDCFSVYAIAYADVNIVTYDTNKTSSATGNNTVTTAVVAPKTDGTDETARTILVFGTAFAMAAIAINIYVFRRRKEEEE